MVVEQLTKRTLIYGDALKSVVDLEVFNKTFQQFRVIYLDTLSIILRDKITNKTITLNILGKEIMLDDLGIIVNKDEFLTSIDEVVIANKMNDLTQIG